MNSATLEQARAVKERARALFAGRAPVVGVGIVKVDGGFGVKVNLGSPLPSGFAPGLPEPLTIDGVPIRVDVVGSIRKR